MIRFSALLTAVAMAMLVAGVSAANLGLIYLSIAVSFLAAVTLAVGVLLRRRELFGAAGAGPRDAQPGSAAETATARPVPARRAAGDSVTAGRGGRRRDNRQPGEQQGDITARPRKAGSGTAADTGPARWPASIAAKGAPVTTRRDGGHPAGRAARTPSGREPAARAGRARTASGQDRDREAAAPNNREQAGRERDEAVAGQHAEAFRLPPRSEQARARAEEPGRAISGDPAGDEFWDRVSGELTGSEGQDPVRPAWPATAGPRAMGTGSAPSDRVAPPHADDLARRGRQQREPERQPAGAGGQPDDDAARAGAPAVPAAASAWSAWSSARAGGHDTAAEEAGRDSADRGTAQERTSLQAAAGAAADTETGAAGDTGGREAEAGAQGDDAADRAGPGGAAEPPPCEDAAEPPPGEDAAGGAERSAHVDSPREPAGSTAEAQNAAEPDSTRDAAGTTKAADADDTGDADKSDGAGVDDEVTVVPGVARYHRRGCILIRFLSDGDLETTTRRAAEAAGSVPCKACQPDKPASAG